MRNPFMNTKNATNSLYCITTKNVNDELLEEKFEADASLYLEPDDGDCIGGFDIDNESIYFLYIDEWKIFKMIDFFSRNHVLIKYELVVSLRLRASCAIDRSWSTCSQKFL